MKKIICLVIVVIMCLSALPLVASAEANAFTATDNKATFFDGDFSNQWREAYTLDHITYTYTSSKYDNGSQTLVDCDVDIEITVLSLSETTYSKTPTALYPMNFTGAYACTKEQNVDRINDLLDQGFIVAVVDFKNHENAVSPYLDWLIQYLRMNTASFVKFTSARYTSDIYVVPQGYGVVRHVSYYDIGANAPEGILDKVTNDFNGRSGSTFRFQKGPVGEDRIPHEYLVYQADNGTLIPYSQAKNDETLVKDGKLVNPEKWYGNAQNAYECVRPDTSPIDLHLYVDIIYPVYNMGADVVMVASSSQNNMSVVNNFCRPMDVSAVIRGYAVAIYEHPYMPMSRADHYDYFDSYSLMGYLGNKSHAAAVRCVRYYADTYGYGKENYASMGISKMAQTGVLTAPEPEAIPEWNVLGSYTPLSIIATDTNGTIKYSKSTTGNTTKYYKDPDGNSLTREDMYGDQPFLAYEDGTPIDSTVSISYHAMGDGSKYYFNWVSESLSPTILACGKFDEYGAWDYWETLKSVYDNLGVEYYAYDMFNLGHDYPYGLCDFYGYDRWAVYYDLVSYYLEGDKEARLAYASIYDHNGDGVAEIVGDVIIEDYVRTGNGTSSNKYKVSGTYVGNNKIFVQFIAPVTEVSVTNAIKLYDSENNEIDGTLRGVSGGSKWYFEPVEELAAGTYTLKVLDNTVVSIKSGKTVTKGGSWTFTVE